MQMRRFLTSLLLMLAALAAADRAGGWLMGLVARHTSDVLGPKLRRLSDGVGEDVVLMGASRCHHHYVTSLLADSLGMSVYNAGVGGSDNIFSHDIVLSLVMQHHTPRLVCLEVMPSDYAPQRDPFRAISFFAPLFGQCERADSVYRQAGVYWRYRVSHLYRYNAKAASNLVGLVIDRQRTADGGYIPLLPSPQPMGRPQPEPAAPQEADPLKTAWLQRFTALCRERGVGLVFVVSPKYTVAGADHYRVLRDFARRNGVPFLDYHTAGLYHDRPEYFHDATHLCDEGARRYTSVFAADLKELLGH